MPLLTKNIEYTKFNTIIQEITIFPLYSLNFLEKQQYKNSLFAEFFQFLQVYVLTLNDLMPWKNPNIHVMIEEHIYHFLTGLSFSFFLPILLLLSPGYWHSPRKIAFYILHCCCNFTTSEWQKLMPTHWRLPQGTAPPPI